MSRTSTNSSRRRDVLEDYLSDNSVSSVGTGTASRRGRGGRGRGRPPSKRGFVQDNRYRVADEVFEDTASQVTVTGGGESPEVGTRDVVMESTPARDVSQARVAEAGADRAKRTVEDRSPQTDAARNVRQRLNEFDLGDMFANVEEQLKKSFGELALKVPEEYRGFVGEGLDSTVQAMHDLMNVISDGVSKERISREAMEMKMEDRLEKVESKVQEVGSATDSLTRNRIRNRVRESIKDMEKVVDESQCCLKLLNVDVGRATDNRRDIVRSTIEEVRNYVKEDDLRRFDQVIRRTRIVILGKATSRWENNDGSGFSVPTLFQCRDGRDREELESIVRSAGYFPSFHWPKEAMEFVNGVREEVRKQGVSTADNYFRIRPERRDGRTRVKVEVKPKNGTGRFTLKGVWCCPPLERLSGTTSPTYTLPFTLQLSGTRGTISM